MKRTIKKRLMALSLVSCLAAGVVSQKVFSAWLSPSTVTLSALTIARDFAVYTNEADTIIIGQVETLGDPYFNQDNSIPQRNVTIAVEDILKGDDDMEDTVSVVVQGGQIGRTKVLVEDEARLIPGERVLLFLGMNNFGESVVFAGPYGKYLIDNNDEATSMGGFKMPLDELVSTIEAELDNQSQH